MKSGTLSHGVYALKRIQDGTGAFLGLVVPSPLLGIIALVAELRDGGADLCRGLRTGLNGSQFIIWKFRTMVVDAERTGVTAMADDGPRTTQVGRFLRKYNLDELPQWVNVLVGEMGLVGPRA